MSSITASDRASSNEEIRRVREEYERQEAENTKRRNREIHSLGEKYDKDLEDVSRSYDHQLQETRNKHGEEIEERDRQHAEDVSKVRQAYQESLRRKAEDESRNFQADKVSHEGAIRKIKDISDNQIKVQTRNFENVIKEKDREEASHQEKSTVDLQNKLKERISKLTSKQDKEIATLAQERDNQIKQKDDDYDALRSYDQNEMAFVKRQNQEEKARRENAYMLQYRNQEHDNNYLLDTEKKELKEEAEHLRNSYAEKLADESKKMERMRENFYDEVQNRTGNRIRAAQAEMSRTHNEQTLDAINNRRLRDLDHEHLMRAEEERMRDLQKQRDQIYEVTNNKARERVNDIIEKTNKLLSGADRTNKMNQSIIGLKNKEAISQLERDHEDAITSLKNRDETRIQNITRTTAQNEEVENHLHEKGREDLKVSYQESLQNQREAQLEVMKNTYTRMEKRLRDLEVNWMKKHDALVNYYEAKTADLKEKAQDEINHQASNYEARIVNQEKGFKTEEESIEQKYAQKMALQEEAHRKEIERLEKRHQEQMQSLASRTNAINKKG